MNKENYIWMGIGVLVIVVLGVVFIPNSNKNSQNSVICNSPYIKVGTSCCLDQNSNNICDNDEMVEEETLICETYSLSLDVVGIDKWKYTIKNPNGIPLTISCNWFISI